MNSETRKLLYELNILTKDLYFDDFANESSDRFYPFIIPLADKEDFTISRIMEEMNFFRSKSIDHFLNEWNNKIPDHPRSIEMTGKYNNILSLLQDNLIDIQVYELIKNNTRDVIYTDYEPFNIIIGKSKDNDWIGLTPQWSRPNTFSFGERLIRQTNSPSQTLLGLIEKLEPILEQTKFIIGDSEGYHPAKKIICQTAQTRALVIEKLLESCQYQKTFIFQGFDRDFPRNFPNQDWNKEIERQDELAKDEEEWWSEYQQEEDDFEETEANYKYKYLEDFLLSNSRNRRVYIMGNMGKFHVYIVGQTRQKDWIGVSTSATWT